MLKDGNNHFACCGSVGFKGNTNLKIRENVNTQGEQEKNYLSLLSHDGEKASALPEAVSPQGEKVLF